MTDPNGHRAQVIDGLRELADFLETHPDLPAPDYPQLNFYPRGDDQAERDGVDRIAAILGVRPTASAGGTHYEVTRRFGGVRYAAIAILEAEMERYRAHMDGFSEQGRQQAATQSPSPAPDGGCLPGCPGCAWCQPGHHYACGPGKCTCGASVSAAGKVTPAVTP